MTNDACSRTYRAVAAGRPGRRNGCLGPSNSRRCQTCGKPSAFRRATAFGCQKRVGVYQIGLMLASKGSDGRSRPPLPAGPNDLSQLDERSLPRLSTNLAIPPIQRREQGSTGRCGANQLTLRGCPGVVTHRARRNPRLSQGLDEVDRAQRSAAARTIEHVQHHLRSSRAGAERLRVVSFRDSVR